MLRIFLQTPRDILRKQVREKNEKISELELRIIELSVQLDSVSVNAKREIDSVSNKLAETQTNLYSTANADTKIGEFVETIAQLQFDLSNKSAALDEKANEVTPSFFSLHFISS